MPGLSLHISTLLTLTHPQLVVRPGVERGGPDKGQVDAERAVDARARQADEDAVGDGRPGRVLGGAVEADLVGGEELGSV